MSYDKDFNNPLIIWTAFGAQANVQVEIEEEEPPELSWQKLYYHNFGYSQHGSQRIISVHNNGNAQIAFYHAQTPYMSYFNHGTGQWTVVDCVWWNHGVPKILWVGNGVFLAKITGFANIIASFNGSTWYNAGYCEGAHNDMTAGAYTASGCGIVSWWYYMTTLYYSFDSLTARTAWNLELLMEPFLL